MNTLETLFISNTPMACYLFKGRLESEGIECYLFDENIVCVDPFKAVAIGGVKLKVRAEQFGIAKKIVDATNQGNLFDEDGTYEITEALNAEFDRQSEILELKYRIRNNPALLDNPKEIKTTTLSNDDVNRVIDSEKNFRRLANKKFIFTWKDFFYHLFDFEGNVFQYLRNKPLAYFLDKEIVDHYKAQSLAENAAVCPQCQSTNTKKGYAIDYKWDILYLLLSLLFLVPFPLIRKKNHCFDCGFDFKRQKTVPIREVRHN